MMPGERFVATDLQAYLADEWRLLAVDSARQLGAWRAVEHLTVDRVLDAGCGGGQDLIPFASRGITCVGVDIVHETAVWATQQFATYFPHLKVRFATSAAEHLPFPDGFFDVVVCRVAIPYTHNRSALAEMSRVLRPGGALLLKTHTAAYYLHKFVEGIRHRSPLFSIHALRVLVSGVIYHVTGWQPNGGLLLKESFQSEWLLAKELARLGMSFDGELPDSNPLTRSYRITKSVR